MPTKLATAPTPWLPERFFVSRERSKSSRCTEIFTSAPGHRREKGDFIAGADPRAGLGHVLVHRGAHVIFLRQRAPPPPPPVRVIAAQRRDPCDAGRQIAFLARR